jgi:acyl-CoA synthetase (AMP-forming)/AMP-acid ligase II
MQVFPLSPRNSPAAIAHLIREVSVTRVLVSKASFTTLISGIDKHLAECNTRVTFEDVPTLADIYPYLARETVPEAIQPMRLPKRRSFVDGIEVYMHSSGSTGMPKAIGYSHQFLAKARHMRKVY